MGGRRRRRRKWDSTEKKIKKQEEDKEEEEKGARDELSPRYKIMIIGCVSDYKNEGEKMTLRRALYNRDSR